MNVPALRFPEFEREWKERRLGDGVSLLSGQHLGPDEYTDTVKSIPYFTGPSDFTDKESELTKWAVIEGKSATKGDVLLTVKGNGVGELTVLQLPKVAMGRQLMALRGEDFLADIVAQVLSSRRQELHALASGNLIPGLSRPAILNLKVCLPSLPEQKKIAAFLGVVDAKIVALRDRVAGLDRYKRGLMQALFSQSLRFTKPDGSAFPDWEEKRLGDVATRSTAKNNKLEYMRVLTNSAVRGVIDQGDYFDKDIANAENLSGYYVLKIGDFVYNPRISVSAPVGPIKRNDLGDGVMSPLYTVFRFHEKDTEFFKTFFETTVWHKYMKAVANYGARHDRMAITSGDLMNMPLPYPHPDEQAKIAEALQAVDAKIGAVRDQLLQMQDFKKGLLQQMFV